MKQIPMAVVISLTMLAAGCKTDDLGNVADLRAAYDKAQTSINPMPPTSEGWTGNTVEKLDFGGAQTAGVFTVEVRGMKPGAGTGENGTTGSGNKPERMFVELYGPHVDKADTYTMHKGRNAVRTSLRSKDKVIAYQSHNANTTGDRPAPTVWTYKWGGGRLWIYAGDELLKDYPQDLGPMSFSGVYIGGTDRTRPFEGEWRNAAFEKGGE